MNKPRVLRIAVCTVIGAVVLLVGCIVYIVVYFHRIDGVSTDEKTARNSPCRPALLVIDIQDGITGTKAPSFSRSMARQSGPFIEKVNRIISRAHERGFPVIYIRHEANDRIFNLLSGNLLAPGDPSAALDPRVTVVDGPVFVKNRMDAFSNPELDAFLSKNNVDHLYMTGLSAAACVDRTIRAALNRGYAVTAITDAIIGETGNKKEARIRQWAERKVATIPTAEFVRYR